MTNSIRCESCGKMIALRLEGELELYCPRCHYYQTVVATTTKVALPDTIQVEMKPLDKV